MSISNRLRKVKNQLYTVFIRRGFKAFGKGSIIRLKADMIIGKRCIVIGSKTTIGKNVQITAWERNNGEVYSPEIIIGDNCQLGSYNHITAINSIIIGNGVLTGKFVTITDNSHGGTRNIEELEKSPINRPAFSKGKVEIGDNVWIGDKATILPNVKIGRGCIIGANSVVTKDIPPFCIVGGNPAAIVRTLI